ncbi:DnaB-like helicase C-terminal domain-containing protein [Paenibacillus xylanexedens]|uniref:DnaB-like helicase C-terminal domain-containing protein n=1 Tax=Paenibacillus xylanexedens TaxID=528191 RepID=UPI00119DABD3|nr:DnaB-like helicase C-terminal domain-containing protein [Paenibacillus xylanexedens]
MIEEIQLINHWLQSKDTSFLAKQSIDPSLFIGSEHIVKWVEKFSREHKALPTAATVATEFPEFVAFKDLDPVTHLTKELNNQRAYMEYRPILLGGAEELNAGSELIESMWKTRNKLDQVLKNYAKGTQHYDWVRNAVSRYEQYMEKHGQEGLAGLPTGIKSLDELTGGWLNDDLILLAGRLNEGKSLLGGFFAFKVWMHQQINKITDPVVLISTEMSALQVSYRLDVMKQHFSMRALKEGKLQEHELYLEYLNDLSKKDTSFLILTHASNGGNPYTPNDIKAVIESERPAFICIDQLYDIKDPSGEHDTRRQIVNNTRAIREINLDTETPTMLLVQAGREAAKDARKNANSAPEADQIQESDAPAQKATRMLSVKRTGDIFRIALKKNRDGEKDKDVYLRSNIDVGNYEEMDEAELVF